MKTSARAPTALRCAIPGVFLALLALLPFYHKAYTIDDSTFILAARHALHDPLHPTAFDMPSGGTIIRVSKLMVNGPVMSYLLVPSALLGGAEWAAHAVQFALFALAVFGTCLLALRLGMKPWQARWAGILVTATPAALAMASTAMADTPALAFGVLGMERVFAWKQERRPLAGVLAAVLLALAALSRPHLGMLIAIGGLALLAQDQRPGWRGWLAQPWDRFLPIVGALGLMLLVIRVTSDPMAHQRTILDATRDVSNDRMSRRNGVAFFGHFVFTLPLALPWLVLHGRRLLSGPLLGTGVAVMGAVMLTSDRPPVILWMAPVAGLGLAVVADVLFRSIQSWRQRDPVPLLLCGWLLISLPVVFYVHLPAKYVGASAPAVALLVVRELDRLTPFRGRALGGCIAALGLGLGMLIMKADAHMVNYTRAAVKELIVPQIAAGKRVWFDGGWGFRWYALKAGAIPLATGQPLPLSGDMLVSARQDAGPMYLVPNRQLVRLLTDSTPGGRVMSQAAGAGFYSNGPGFGYLPWAWGRDPIESIALWEVR